MSLFLLLSIAFLLVILTFVWPPDSPWSPWWRTNKKIAKVACNLSKLSKNDIVYELGSGDGEFILMAGTNFNVKKAVGIEIDYSRYFISKFRAHVLGCKNVKFVRRDFKKVKVSGLASYVFTRFYFDTADAMGMNMVTIASEAISRLIEKDTGARLISVAGNFDIDKKPAWINFIDNRGIKVWSEVILTKEVLENTLKTTAEKFFDVWLAKCMIGSAMSGSLGFNAQYANIIAGMFIATGQDPAHIVEGSMGITTAKVLKNNDLLVAVYLPALQVGILGGGTGLGTQKEALEILGVKGSGNSEKFAEIIGGAVLAGEISLLSSLSEGTLAKAHQKLGRG
jgi:hydroxymethylglutaryl-CoA reductase (NADPH)